MTPRTTLFLALLSLVACRSPEHHPIAPPGLSGSWEDDYGIRFEISDTAWFQRPRARYRAIRWDLDERFLVARNGDDNPADAGLYTRIDWVGLEQSPPWEWAFCLAIWDANSAEAASLAPASDRQNPRTGCGGHPFSRMRRLPADSAALPGSGYP